MDRPLSDLKSLFSVDGEVRMNDLEYSVMMSDGPIITPEKLREGADFDATTAPEALLQNLCRMAAYEIERLIAEVARKNSEVESLLDDISSKVCP